MDVAGNLTAANNLAAAIQVASPTNAQIDQMVADLNAVSTDVKDDAAAGALSSFFGDAASMMQQYK